mgnify:CR=1 FL=1|jgi:hypothetical protein
MSEKVELKIASKESVALELAIDIAAREKFYDDLSTYRKKLLDLYVECLNATNGRERE